MKYPKTTIDSEYLTMQEVMNMYRLSKPAIYSLIKRGILPQGLRLGKSRRWTLTELKEAEKALRLKEVY